MPASPHALATGLRDVQRLDFHAAVPLFLKPDETSPSPIITPCQFANRHSGVCFSIAFRAGHRHFSREKMCIRDSAQWNDSALRPFTMNHRHAGSSAVDLSFLLDAPAGKSGFVRVQGGHFVKGDGSRIRFWGVHLTDWSPGSVLLPPKEDIPMWANSLARFGVNCVRLHFLDLPAPRGIIDGTKDDSRSFDPQQLDRLDFMVRCV